MTRFSHVAGVSGMLSCLFSKAVRRQVRIFSFAGRPFARRKGLSSGLVSYTGCSVWDPALVSGSDGDLRDPRRLEDVELVLQDIEARIQERRGRRGSFMCFLMKETVGNSREASRSVVLQL